MWLEEGLMGPSDIPGLPSQSCWAVMETNLWGLNISASSSADLESPHNRAAHGKEDVADLGESMKKTPEDLGYY